ARSANRTSPMTQPVVRIARLFWMKLLQNNIYQRERPLQFTQGALFLYTHQYNQMNSTLSCYL
ncbi:hypothetical protein, partial [uncultured Veillonella sp.]|uniref:hypothetical protein n=1 Tax=uncultured Veillonella sp. TaxID=159268 RepID=UPI002584443F